MYITNYRCTLQNSKADITNYICTLQFIDVHYKILRQTLQIIDVHYKFLDIHYTILRQTLQIFITNYRCKLQNSKIDITYCKTKTTNSTRSSNIVSSGIINRAKNLVYICFLIIGYYRYLSLFKVLI